MAVRSDNKMMMAPYLYRTSERVDAFFANCVKYSLSDFVLRMECWVISGADGTYPTAASVRLDLLNMVPGVSRNYRDTLAELKTKTKDLIKEKLGVFLPRHRFTAVTQLMHD